MHRQTIENYSIIGISYIWRNIILYGLISEIKNYFSNNKP